MSEQKVLKPAMRERMRERATQKLSNTMLAQGSEKVFARKLQYTTKIEMTSGGWMLITNSCWK